MKKKLFLDSYFNTKYQIQPLPQDCSTRFYDRIITAEKSFVLMNSPVDSVDLKPFIQIDNILCDNDFSAPKLYKIDEKNGFILLEDFGNNSFNNILNNFNQSDLKSKEEEIYQYSLDLLIKLHEIDISNIDIPQYDNALLMQEVLIFPDFYLKFIKNRILTEQELKDFKEIWLEIFSKLSDDKFLILRDFHADNLFFLDNRNSFKKIGLIDFQDAVIGSRAYDLVSLLQDARRDVTQDLQSKIIKSYIAKTNIDSEKFLVDYNILSLQRNIKILGIFSRQAIVNKNKRYLDLIPRVLEYVLKSFDEEKIFNEFKLFLKW